MSGKPTRVMLFWLINHLRNPIKYEELIERGVFTKRPPQSISRIDDDKYKKLLNPKVVLISIHPEYVEKILNGEKQWEFRRSWSAKKVDFMVIYSTSPVKRVVAVIEVGEKVVGSKQKLWELSRDCKGGVSRRKLFTYLKGKDKAVAIQLKKKWIFKDSIAPEKLFGEKFRAPQSFCYVNDENWQIIKGLLKESNWE
jgi:Uncharacterized conserved protein